MGAPPTHPHLLLPILQALLTSAGHLSHHHSNPSCASQPPQQGADGWRLPSRMVEAVEARVAPRQRPSSRRDGSHSSH